MFLWAQFFLYVLVTAGTPGPNTLSSMSNGSRLGFCLNLCWAGFGSLLRVLFSRYAAIVNKVMALLMVWCAVRLFL